MGFSALKSHCASLDIKLPFGATKSSMIKLVLAADPPPVVEEAPLSKEEQLKRQVTAPDVFDSAAPDGQPAVIDLDDDYKSNTISLNEARKIVKQYCPQMGGIGGSTYNSFLSMFRDSKLQSLSVSQFVNGLVSANTALLGTDFFVDIHRAVGEWTALLNWNVAKERLYGFVAPPEAKQPEKLMFSIFNIPDLMDRLSLIQMIQEVLSL